jgi:hypothetical protein
MRKCENAKISMRCKNANAMPRSKKESHRIALLFSLKKTGKIIDRSLFRIRIALPALGTPTKEVIYPLLILSRADWSKMGVN